MNDLQLFLVERKTKLLGMEKRAPKGTQQAILGQLQSFDAILAYLASKQTEDDMTKLQLSLDNQIVLGSEIKPRHRLQDVTDALIAKAEWLDAKLKEVVKTHPKEDMIGVPLNDLPLGMKNKNISTKIYTLLEEGTLPPEILPSTRTIMDEETGVKKETVFLTRSLKPRYVKRGK